MVQRKLSLYTDGACTGNPGPSGIGGVLRGKDIEDVTFSEPIGDATNNQAEYAAVIYGLTLAKKLGATEVVVYTDSQLVQRQLIGRYQCNDPNIRPQYEEAKALMKQFTICEVHHIEREHNHEADRLAVEGKRKNADSVARTNI